MKHRRKATPAWVRAGLTKAEAVRRRQRAESLLAERQARTKAEAVNNAAALPSTASRGVVLIEAQRVEMTVGTLVVQELRFEPAVNLNPTIHVAPAQVVVQMPTSKRTVKFEHDRDGQVIGATITTGPGLTTTSTAAPPVFTQR